MIDGDTFVITNEARTGWCLHRQTNAELQGGNKGLYVLLSRTQAGPGRTVKQEQEDISRNHVQTFIFPSIITPRHIQPRIIKSACLSERAFCGF